jgi:protein SCO1
LPLMKRKTIFYILFFILLFGGFLYALGRVIPGFGTVKLPVLSYVQPFSFTNQYGRTITQQDVAGKVYVTEYFFTTCKGICPKMNTNMHKVHDYFINEKEFLILSHTVDPETDSVGRMKRYADSLGITGNNWWFLTGRKDSLYKAARVSYLLDDPKNSTEKIEDQFIHTQFFALVDRNGQLRKIYDGLKKDEITEMLKDIQVLLNEKSGSTFANGMFNNNPN